MIGTRRSCKLGWCIKAALYIRYVVSECELLFSSYTGYSVCTYSCSRARRRKHFLEPSQVADMPHVSVMSSAVMTEAAFTLTHPDYWLMCCSSSSPLRTCAVSTNRESAVVKGRPEAEGLPHNFSVLDRWHKWEVSPSIKAYWCL